MLIGETSATYVSVMRLAKVTKVATVKKINILWAQALSVITLYLHSMSYVLTRFSVATKT